MREEILDPSRHLLVAVTTELELEDSLNGFIFGFPTVFFLYTYIL